MRETLPITGSAEHADGDEDMPHDLVIANAITSFARRSPDAHGAARVSRRTIDATDYKITARHAACCCIAQHLHETRLETTSRIRGLLRIRSNS
jgi:hypothetical protein